MYKNSSSSGSRKAAAGRSVWSRIDGAGCGRAGGWRGGGEGWAPLSVRGARRGSRGVSCLGSQCRWCHLPPTLRGNTAVSPASCLSLRLLPPTPRACSCLLCNNNNNFAGERTVSVALDRTPRHSTSTSTSRCSSATFPLPSASSSSHAHPSCSALFPEPSSFQPVAPTLACPCSSPCLFVGDFLARRRSVSCEVYVVRAWCCRYGPDLSTERFIPQVSPCAVAPLPTRSSPCQGAAVLCDLIVTAIIVRDRPYNRGFCIVAYYV